MQNETDTADTSEVQSFGDNQVMTLSVLVVAMGVGGLQEKSKLGRLPERKQFIHSL